MSQTYPKSPEEILARFRELVRRYRRRYIKRNLAPCPLNCKHAELAGRKVVGCGGCGSANPEFCKDPRRFEPLCRKQELADQFNRMLRDPQVLLQEYRDLVAFMWCLGGFDKPAAVPEHIISGRKDGSST